MTSLTMRDWYQVTSAAQQQSQPIYRVILRSMATSTKAAPTQTATWVVL
jgi:hypothetical protein